MSPPGDLAPSYRACARITRRRAVNFYYGIRLTPRPKRDSIYAVYAWMRRADDLADAPARGVDRAGALRQWREQTARAYDGAVTPSEGRIWPAFQHTVRTYPVRREWFDALIDGVEADLHHSGYEDFGELEAYCERVASTVGRICVAVWGLRPGVDAGAADALASRRGVALQLINIARDIGKDGASRPPRVYVPRSVMREHSVTPEGLLAWKPGAEACVRAVLDRARRHYEAARPLDGMIEASCAPAARAIASIYERILTILEADPGASVSTRPAGLATRDKVALALRIMRDAAGSR